MQAKIKEFFLEKYNSYNDVSTVFNSHFYFINLKGEAQMPNGENTCTRCTGVRPII